MATLHQMAATINDRCRPLINNDLKRICKEEGLAVTGNKAALQARISNFVNEALRNVDTATLQRMLFRVQNHGHAPPPPPATSSSPAVPSFSHHPQAPPANYAMPNGYQGSVSYPAFAQSGPSPYFFKESPFFEIREQVLGGFNLESSPSHRQNARKILTLNDTQCARLKADATLRLLLFGAVEQPLAPYTRLDVSFPSQIEVRINTDEVKANFKGLKNKPGSTRPADITDFVRKTPANYRNEIVITYALTQKVSESREKFNLCVYMVKKFSVEELTRRIKQRNVITRQSVLNEMVKKANDPDIEVGSSVMSLKDPISTLRISTPCRSMVCTHNQCFDAESFLQLQEQAPTWTCPICNKTISYEGLAVDEYVEEILNKVRNADQVTIQANGEWSLEKDPAPPSKNGYHPHDDSDGDLVEILDYHPDRVSAIKNEAAPTPVSLSTPLLQSRETSTAPRTGTKRPSEVVDLTLSDDDEPVRPAKKVAYHPSSHSDSSRRYLAPLSNPVPPSRPFPPSYPTMHSNSRLDYPQPPSTPPERNGYGAYRQPAQPNQRPAYPGQGTSQYPAYLDSSP